MRATARFLFAIATKTVSNVRCLLRRLTGPGCGPFLAGC
jgi:hypothetical protein